MTANLKPIVLWGGVTGPNPPKVAMLLTELNVPYEPKYIPLSEIKGNEFTKINPNGRLPAIEDPNTGITLWESGAILEYLIAEYDKEYKLSFQPGTPEFYHAQQWLFFQMSGQGPYYGQVWYFRRAHTEKVQSVIDRFITEVKRVSKVLDNHLATHQYIVGDKCSYVDLAWVPWQHGVPDMLADQALKWDPAREFPHVQAWLERIRARPAIQKVMEERELKKVAMEKEAKEKAASEKKY